MAKLGINTGTAPNDGTGDSLLSGAIKINANFDEIYAALGTGTTITNSIDFASVAGYSTAAGISSYSQASGYSNYAILAGVSSVATNANVATYSVTAGISTVAYYADNFSGVPNVTVGVITASSYRGNGTLLTGIVTSIVAGTNVAVSTSKGSVVISSFSSDTFPSKWTSVNTGIVTTANVGIGTNLPLSSLHLNNATVKLGTTGAVNIDDNISVNFGSGGSTDSSVYFDSTNLNIDIPSKLVVGDGNNRVLEVIGGEGPILYYNGVKKLDVQQNKISISGDVDISRETYIEGGLNVVGVVTTFEHFSGDATGLTNIPANEIVGALPAIDGSNLTGFTPLQSRTVVVGVTTEIESTGVGYTDVTGFKSYALMRVGLSHTEARVRIYTDNNSRNADVNREFGVQQTNIVGLVADIMMDSGIDYKIFAPYIIGGNFESSPTDTIYLTINNLTGVTTSLSASLTILQLESW